MTKQKKNLLFWWKKINWFGLIPLGVWKILRPFLKSGDKFVRKKILFSQIFCSVQSVLELQYVVADLVDFLEFLMLIIFGLFQ